MVGACRNETARRAGQGSIEAEAQGKETEMIYKRGKVYWYKFMWNGQLIRESTKQGNDKVARSVEADRRAGLAREQGERETATKQLRCERVVRCVECQKWINATKAIRNSLDCEFCSNDCLSHWQRRSVGAVTLQKFLDDRFLPWAKSSFEKSTPNNWRWFRTGVRALTAYKPLANAPLDTINNEIAAEFASYRMREQEAQVSTVNSSLRVLRRALRLGVEWGVIQSAPKLALIPGERHRERVITPEEEQRYLEKAPEPCKSVSIVLADTGMRPEECYRVRWENLNWQHGRSGSVLVPFGKTASARRFIPLTPRVRFVLEARWEFASKPADGWVWPAPTKSGHIEQSSLKKQHAGTFRKVNTAAKEHNDKVETDAEKQRPLKPWVPYSFRHTFLTRLGESGCDAWTLARIAGHSSIVISSRYVHPCEDAVLNAISNLGGHNSRHNEKAPEIPSKQEKLQLTVQRKSGAPGGIRTPDLVLRRHTLYPSELRARMPHFISRSAVNAAFRSYLAFCGVAKQSGSIGSIDYIRLHCVYC
jgi:integrase